MQMLLILLLGLVNGALSKTERQDHQIATWLLEADSPGYCETILEYDLAEWPDGLGALLLCMDRSPDYYAKPAHPSCETWASLLREPRHRRELAQEIQFSEHELMGQALRGWADNQCDESRRDRLFHRARHQKAKREAEWACEFAVLEANSRYLCHGLPEIDEMECWSFFGGKRWRRFYEGPEER